MEFMTHLFEKEVNDHNSTRSRLHRYLNLYMKHERGQCADRSHVRYLNMVIQGLQNQLLEEKAKRKAAEETQALLLRSDLDSFSCVSTSGQLSPYVANSFEGLSHDD